MNLSSVSCPRVHRSLSRRLCRRGVHVHALPDPTKTASARPIDGSRQLAWCRNQESKQQQSLFVDPYAAALAATAPEGYGDDCNGMTHRQHVVATKYLDELLLNAMNATNVNSISKGDYRQVVLVGDGLDTRPFRLPWPPGTVLFMIAASECHELAEHILKQAGASVPRGCLLRRVNADLQRSGATFARDLEAAGFRADRLSVWALQGLSGLRLTTPAIKGLLTDVTNMAAFNSLVFGELPAMSHPDADNLLAEFGLLGSTVNAEGLEPTYRDAAGGGPQLGEPENCETLEATAQQPWLFSSQHMRLSLAQMGVYEGHRQEFEEMDEDYTDNFS